MFNTPPTPYDLSFRFLGFSVRVQPLFWIVFLFLGLNFNGSIKDGDLMPWLVNLVLWIAAVFVSILVHELGHALVFRHVFHVPSSITLHGFGGVTAPYYQHQRKYGFSGLCREVFLNAAGALAAFFLAAVFLFFLAALHHTGTFDMHDREYCFPTKQAPCPCLLLLCPSRPRSRFFGASSISCRFIPWTAGRSRGKFSLIVPRVAALRIRWCFRWHAPSSLPC